MRLRVLLVGGIVLLTLVAVVATGLAAEPSLNEVQKKIQKTDGQLGQKRGKARVLTSRITTYNRRIGRLQGEITTLATRQTRLEADLAAKRATLSRTQASLRQERGRLIRLRAKLNRARRTLSKRLLELYKSDRPDLVTVVLNSKGFADLLERVEFISRISKQDRQIITIVKRARVDARDSSLRLASLEQRQKQVAVAVMRRRDEIASTKGKLIDTRVGYSSARAGMARTLRSVRSDVKELEGKRENLIQQEAKIQAALQGTNVGTLPAGPIRAGSGQLIWPVNGPITSPFCERRSWESCHPGIDVAVPNGTPIRAAATGRVALTQSSGSSGGYGNFTCIAHTATMSTCYAHQSSIGVRTGQAVSQGQVIGISGCTGRCYGPHLHFEVRINGIVSNPVNYL